MDKLLNENPATKRLVVGLGAMVTAALSTKLGISENLALSILGLAGVMITGSNWKEAKVAGAAAAAKIENPAQAVAVFNEAPK